MTCKTPATSDQFMPEEQLPLAAAGDAEVPPLKVGSCTRTMMG